MTATPSLSLPKGGGALRGIGEKFTFNAFAGTGTIAVPIPFTKSRGDLQPNLTLTYDSGAGNGVFGAGWRLDLAAVSRKTDKRLPRYEDLVPADVFVFSGDEDLVPTEPDHVQSRDGYLVRRFRPRVEGGFARIEWWVHSEHSSRNHWRVISRENVTHILGFSASARISDPSSPSRIFQWLLECSFDDKGNAIVYRYRPEDLAGTESRHVVSEAHRLQKIVSVAGSHLESVLYGNVLPFFPQSGADYWSTIETLIASSATFSDHWHFRAVLKYAAGSAEDFSLDDSAWSIRRDPYSSYRAGFEVRCYRLCQKIIFETNIAIEVEGRETGYTGITHALRLNYDDPSTTAPSDGRVGSPILSKLRSIQQVHVRRTQPQPLNPPGYETAAWPALEFRYSSPGKMELKHIPHQDALTFPEGVDGARFEWVDLDGEGIQGVLSRYDKTWWYAPNRWATQHTPTSAPNEPTQGGVLELQKPLRFQPVTATGNATAQLVDLAGDGSLDVLERSPVATLLYERTAQGGWERPRALSRRPAYPLDDPNLRMIDLDGDGRAELVLFEDDCLVWQESLGEEGYGAVHRIAKVLDERHGPRCVLSEITQTIFLADMSGDGLTDIVRIRNGDICYWPNLGYGRFGARVVMDDAPVFDASNQFDPGRIRLLDADGSGVADLVYLGRKGAAFWANESGNGWSAPNEIPFRLPHSVASVTNTDFYGRGTDCLVWSSPAPADTGSHFCVVDLTGGTKPHLLTFVGNNMGAETELFYRSSTEFYLRDLAEGHRWITRLPFPVHVLEKVITHDLISRNHFVSRYAYHHGFFDGVEREFRGFGMVEQWDTEQIGAVSTTETTSSNWDSSSYVPPKLTKTWFHHGAWRQDGSLTAAFKATYWRDPKALDLPESLLPGNLSTDEEREACRALRGRMLRQEIYALDATETSSEDVKKRAACPYETTEQNFTIEMLQPRGKNQHAVFFVHDRETLHAHYERIQPLDPRVTHDMTLKVDAFGNVEQSIAIGYRRRQPEPVDPAEMPRQRLTFDEQAAQQCTLLTLTDSSFTNAVDAPPDTWRTPLPAEQRVYELTYTQWKTSDALSFETLREAAAQLESISEINYEASAGYTLRERRCLYHTRTFYRSDDLKTLLPLGQLESRGLHGETLKLAVTAGLSGIYEGKAGPDELAGYLRDRALGYAEPDGDGNFWVPSGRTFFSPEASGSRQGASTELAFARKRFFLPHKFVDGFGNSTRVKYDDAILRIAEITDAGANTTQATYDYRVLQPKLLTDADGNHVAAAFDLRGMVVATAVLGKDPSSGDFGDNLQDLKADLDEDALDRFLADPVGEAPILLGSATTRFVYDVMRFFKSNDKSNAKPSGKPVSPVFAATLERRFHVDLPFKGDESARVHAGLADFALHDHIQCRFSYSDGFGREIQQKVRTAPQIKDNPAATKPRRWIGSGWTIFNNKGQPVRQYEPFFREDEGGSSHPHHFEFSPAEGVSPILFYDPLGRVAATLHPDYSWEKVVFSTWKRKTWDNNDTVLLDPFTDPDVSSFFQRLPPAEKALPTWYDRRTRPDALDKYFPKNTAQAIWRRTHEIEAAEHTAYHAGTPHKAHHAGTPVTTHFDTLGREFIVVTHNRFTDPRSNVQKEEFARTRTILDIEGNRRSVIDALGRAAMVWDYDLLGRPLRETSIDAGSRWTLPDAASQPAYRWDERHHFFRHTYDTLRRPAENWITEGHHSADAQANTVCYERFSYGDDATAPTDANLRGRLWKHHDTAGLVRIGGYDAKGNLLVAVRQLCRDYKSTPDWSSSPVLNDEKLSSSTDFDVLNRPIRFTTPYAQDRPTYRRYNLAGQLSATTVDTPPEPFLIVRGIDYNARGQRVVVQYGNNANGYGLRTTSSYDRDTFRLMSLVTANTDKDSTGARYQSLDYAYDPVGNVTAIRDTAQQTLYFNKQWIEPDAAFEYDALYRLTFASGREHSGQNLPPNAWDAHRMGTFGEKCYFSSFPNPNDPKAMRNYEQRYAYDAVGNIEAMKHHADPNGSWERVYGYELEAGSRDKKSNRLVRATIGRLSWKYDYDEHGSMISMPHLPKMETDFRDQLRMTTRQQVTCTADQPYSPGDVTYYVYDAGGERVRKITERDGKRVAERIYVGQGEIYRSYTAGGDDIDGERRSLHVSDGERRFALFETLIKRAKNDKTSASQVIRCQFPNHLGSACLEVQFDKKAPVISYEEFHPHGTTAYQAINDSIKAASKRFRFTGKERDEESGLNYHSARYLAPWLGRWISRDPLGIDADIVGYAYASNRPLAFLDSSGTSPARSGGDSYLGPTGAAFASAHSITEGAIWNPTVFGNLSRNARSTINFDRGTLLEKFLGNIDRLPGALGHTARDADRVLETTVEQIKTTYAKDIAAVARKATRDATKYITRHKLAKEAQAVINVPTGTSPSAIASAKAAVKASPGVTAAPKISVGIPGIVGIGLKALAPIGATLSALSLPQSIEQGDIVGTLRDAAGFISGSMETAAIGLHYAGGSSTALIGSGGVAGAGLATGGAVVGAFALGATIGKTLEDHLHVGDYSSDFGVAVYDNLKGLGLNDTASLVIGGAASFAAIPSSIGYAAVTKLFNSMN